MSIAREAAYRNLAEQATQAQSRTADRLDQAVTELAELRRRAWLSWSTCSRKSLRFLSVKGL
jgi:hypothetical protein